MYENNLIFLFYSSLKKFILFFCVILIHIFIIIIYYFHKIKKKLFGWKIHESIIEKQPIRIRALKTPDLIGTKYFNGSHILSIYY